MNQDQQLVDVIRRAIAEAGFECEVTLRYITLNTKPILGMNYEQSCDYLGEVSEIKGVAYDQGQGYGYEFEIDNDYSLESEQQLKRVIEKYSSLTEVRWEKNADQNA